MTIRPLRPEETLSAAQVAARAFFDDPLFQHVYPNPARRLEGFAREHAIYIRHIYSRVGICEVAEHDGHLVGMSLWLPPGAKTSAWREWMAVPTMLWTIGPRHLMRVLRDYQAFDAVWPEGTFSYLGLLAVDPSAQGRGIGSALVRAGLTRSDRDGVGTFLETGTVENVGFYERHGFRVTDDVELPYGPRHWAMWRAPV